MTEGQQLFGGTVALLLATACVIILTMVWTGSEMGAMALGLLSVALFVAGALVIGVSETAQV